MMTLSTENDDCPSFWILMDNNNQEKSLQNRTYYAKEVRLTNFQWLQKSERKRATNDTFFSKQKLFHTIIIFTKGNKISQDTFRY